MPQIWLTFNELAEFIRLPVTEARNIAAKRDMPRRHCSDDQTRVKLPQEAVMDYVVHAVSNNRVVLEHLQQAMADTTPLVDEGRGKIKAA